MSTELHQPPALQPSVSEAVGRRTKRERRRAFMASYLGTVVEYYDFILYGAAAGLVFPHIFFADLGPAIGTVLSFAILLGGYIARPIGGLICGHLGDKYGRKNVLVVTMLVMGAVSVLIGLLPTYAAIGVAAPILLTALRIVQGLAIGGEWAGATLMSAEHAGDRRRGMGASISIAGAPSGSLISTVVFAIFAGLPQEAFLSWGWRVPFLFSAALVLVGLYLRYNVTESPEFEAARKAGKVRSGVPIMRILRQYPGTAGLLILAGIPVLFLNGVMVVFMVPHLVGLGHYSQQSALMLLSISTFLQIFTTIAFGVLSDRWGRARTLLIGCCSYVVLVFPAFMMLTSGSAPITLIGFILGNSLLQSMLLAPYGAYLADHFQTRDRYTGTSLTFQIASILGAGIAPLMSTWLIGMDNGWGVYNVAAYLVLLSLLGVLAILLLRRVSPARGTVTAD